MWHFLLPRICGCLLSLPSGRQDDDRKLRFMLDAMDSTDPFADSVVVPDDVKRAIEWQRARSPRQAMAEREMIISGLEQKAHAFRCDVCHAHATMLGV